MSTFKAVRIDKVEGGTKAAFVDFDEKDLMAGDVDVRVSYSTVNYKDGLALTGKSPVVRRFPMIPGIDFAGTVEASRHPEFKPGDKVVLNGWGVGETHLGGYAQRARVSGDWLIALPAGFSEAEAMAIGTAGYTAMLALMALERHGARPEQGPALVTGASGGVGSVAIALLAKAGWHVIASTGRPQEAPYLKELGAAEIIDRGELAGSGKPLMAERWAAGIDSVGSRTLANALAHTKVEGRHRGLRPRPGHRSAGDRRAIHPARRFPARDQQRHGGQAPACRGLAAPRRRTRSCQARPDHVDHPVRAGDRCRQGASGWPSARPHRRRDRLRRDEASIPGRPISSWNSPDMSLEP